MIEIKAKTVINCAGFNADNLFNKEDPQYNKLISTSKGSKLYFI
jgi:glycerol-3-phosphate dehydrogenase